MPMPIRSAVEQRWYRTVLVQSSLSADKSNQSSGSSKQCWFSTVPQQNSAGAGQSKQISASAEQC